MAYPLTIIVDSSALKPIQKDHYMRPGSIGALKKLADHGVLLAGNTETFDDTVTRLLNQERISFRKTEEIMSGKEDMETLTIRADTGGRLRLEPDTGQTDKDCSCDEWDELVRLLLGGYRSATHSRKTGETEISVSIRLDGSGKSDIHTGIPFFDHMLDQIARHGYMDLSITCDGDLEIDEHHTIEDTAITLGEATGMALGDKRGVGRYGFMVAMDETRSLVAIDLSGRPYCVFEGGFQREKVGAFPTEMTSHFFHSLAMALKATLHISVKGENDHHQIEACFKGLARCLRQAVDRNEKYRDILPSSKGLL